MNTAYTAPVFGTTSMIGSACEPTPEHVQMKRSGPHVTPPSLDTFSMM